MQNPTQTLPFIYRLYQPVHHLFTSMGWLKIGGKHPFMIARNLMNRVMFKYIFTSSSTIVVDTIDGFKMEVPLNDQASASILFEKHYSRDEVHQASKLIAVAGGFMDIGANLGYFSLLARHLRGNDYPVMTVEPNAMLCWFIEKSMEHNQFATVELKQFAVSDTVGKAFIAYDSALSSSGIVVDHQSAGVDVDNVQDIDLISIDQLRNWADTARPFLIKIDVEGFEVKALKGSRDALEARVWIMCEVFAQSASEISLILDEQDYIILDYSGNIVSNLKHFRRADFLFIPREDQHDVIQLLSHD